MTLVVAEDVAGRGSFCGSPSSRSRFHDLGVALPEPLFPAWRSDMWDICIFDVQILGKGPVLKVHCGLVALQFDIHEAQFCLAVPSA